MQDDELYREFTYFGESPPARGVHQCAGIDRSN
jgi:hypothetical protein